MANWSVASQIGEQVEYWRKAGCYWPPSLEFFQKQIEREQLDAIA
jgi:hypothetical protein